MTKREQFIINRFLKLVNDYKQKLKELVDIVVTIKAKAIPYLEENNLADNPDIAVALKDIKMNNDLVEQIIKDENVMQIIKEFKGQLDSWDVKNDNKN